MKCLQPLDDTWLADYWLGLLSGSAEESVEEHLLACDACGARLRETMALAAGVREVARCGTLLQVVSEELVRRIADGGAHVRAYTLSRGGSVQCTVTAEDDLLVARLEADLHEVRRLDLALCDPEGRERLRLADIPFRPAAGHVIFQHSIAAAKAAPSECLVARLLTWDDAGSEHLLGEYTFHHTRTLPGPGGG